jgi:hypothetical protein
MYKQIFGRILQLWNGSRCVTTAGCGRRTISAFRVITCPLALVSWRARIRVICAVRQEASAGAALLMAWACTGEYVDDVLGMS